MVTLTKPALGAIGVATSINQNWTDIEAALNAIEPFPGLSGDGSDGSATISGTTTLTRDMFYTTLTVQSSGVLVTAGYRVYAKTSVTVDAGGVIRNNGSNGAAGVGGTGAPAGSVGGGGWGDAFGAAFGQFNAYGGNGGTGSFSGGTNFPPSTSSGQLRIPIQLYTGILFSAGNHTLVKGGAGGGAGAANAGGGGGGGVLLLVTPLLTLNGTIEAKGGNGNGTAGGGGGGVPIIVYGRKTGSGTISAAAGTGGTGATAGTIFEVTP